MIMPPGLRKFALTVHLTSSVGWIGAVAAYIALDLAAARGQDAQTLRAAYLAMEWTASLVIVPLALATLLTGLVMSLGIRWGLFRHYWTVISLLLTVFATVVLLAETRTISYFADRAADPATSGEELRALGSSMMAQFVKTPNRAMIRAVCSFLCDKMLDKAVDAHASCLCRCRQASRITPDPGPAGAILIGARSAFLPVAHRGLARSGLERRGRLTLLHRPAHVCLPTTRRSWQSTPQLVGDTRAPRAADARCRSE